MQEKAQCQMGYPQCPHLLFSPHLLTILTLALLLIAVCSCGHLSPSASLTLLAMVLSPSLFVVFSKGKQLRESNAVKNPRGMEASCDVRTGNATLELHKRFHGEEDEHRVNGFATAGSPSPAIEGEAEEILLDSVDQIPACSDSSVSDDDTPGSGTDRAPVSSDGSASDNESSVGDMDRAAASSESSISDEEGLIEIALPEGHSVVPGGQKNPPRPHLQEFLPDLLPELVFRQPGLLDLLAEISEEDNLIEIDIAVGSVKCPRLGISV